MSCLEFSLIHPRALVSPLCLWCPCGLPGLCAETVCYSPMHDTLSHQQQARVMTGWLRCLHIRTPVNCICLYFFCGPSEPCCLLRRFFLAGDPDISPASIHTRIQHTQTRASHTSRCAAVHTRQQEANKRHTTQPTFSPRRGAQSYIGTTIQSRTGLIDCARHT